MPIGDEFMLLAGPTGITDQSGNGYHATYMGGATTVAESRIQSLIDLLHKP
jgi:hypothetical protein